jgi:steroid 5-alpha reductase family enzyme
MMNCGHYTNKSMSKMQSIIILSLVIVFATLFAWSGGQHTREFELSVNTSMSLFAAGTFIVFVIQWLAFVPSYLKKTEHFYDLVGGMSYLIFIGGIFIFSPEHSIRSIILATMVSVWALRLSLFLFKRVLQDGSDSRFDEIKLDFMRFLIAWTVQGLWIVITAGCAAAAISTEQKVAINLVDLLAIGLWFLGFAIEVIADQQKRHFKHQENKTSPFIRDGLWRYSRHPNYFGEILLWIGVTLLAFPVLVGWQYLTLISPLFVTLLLTKISGIPLLEAKADKRWKDSVEYQQYKRTTPVLIPKFSSY